MKFKSWLIAILISLIPILVFVGFIFLNHPSFNKYYTYAELPTPLYRIQVSDMVVTENGTTETLPTALDILVGTLDYDINDGQVDIHACYKCVNNCGSFSDNTKFIRLDPYYANEPISNMAQVR